jgi:hypothetical protein
MPPVIVTPHRLARSPIPIHWLTNEVPADRCRRSQRTRNHHRHSPPLPALADRLKLTPITHWGYGDEGKLVINIDGFTGVALVCWEHKAIIATQLPALLAGQQIPDLPAKWDGARFDVVLRLDRTSPTAPWSFRQLFPQLLNGDSDAPVQLPL